MHTCELNQWVMHGQEVDRSGEAGQCLETGCPRSDIWPSSEIEATFLGESDVTHAKKCQQVSGWRCKGTHQVAGGHPVTALLFRLVYVETPQWPDRCSTGVISSDPAPQNSSQRWQGREHPRPKRAISAQPVVPLDWDPESDRERPRGIRRWLRTGHGRACPQPAQALDPQRERARNSGV